MRATTLTTLLLPFILSSVLAVPTPVGQNNAIGGALEVRAQEDCGESISLQECDAIHAVEEDESRLPDDKI